MASDRFARKAGAVMALKSDGATPRIATFAPFRNVGVSVFTNLNVVPGNA
jgi:hypothetical protein